MSDEKKLAPTTAIAQAGLKVFADYIKGHEAALGKVAASQLRPDRVSRMVLSCVSRTPALQQCTMQSVLLAMMQSAELGLEPGSQLGEAYLVPYRDRCQLIVGYRGLITLAYRSGEIKSIQSQVVYEGDTFEFEQGLQPKLRHIPRDTPRDPAKITHAYCVIHLKDGGVQFDVMTREEIERIRARSKAGGAGPWVTDYAEMSKKTVTRRALKYAPMSIEMSKALSVDVAADTGDEAALNELEAMSVLDADFEAEPEKPAHGTAVKEKIDAKQAKRQPTLGDNDA